MSELTGVFADLTRFTAELRAVIETRLKRQVGVSLAQVERIAALDRLGVCRLGDLAHELCISTGAASKLVDRFEAQGHVRRRRDPRNRRITLIELTEQGLGLFAAAGSVLDAELERRLGADAVPPPQLRRFGATLRALRAAQRP